VTRQIGVDLPFMKADLVRFPTLVPESRFYVRSLPTVPSQRFQLSANYYPIRMQDRMAFSKTPDPFSVAGPPILTSLQTSA
jgi:hypothetical protein